MGDVAAADDLDPPEDVPLWAELATVSERINRAEEVDLPRRDELYEVLTARGYSQRQIAEVASTGRSRPLTDKSVAFVIHKRRRQREGTWDPKKRATGRRRR